MVPPIAPDSLKRCLTRAKQNDRLGELIAQAISLIEKKLDGLGEEAIAISFNGGKDCTVLLHLLAAVLLARHTRSAPEIPPSRSPDDLADDVMPNGHSHDVTHEGASHGEPSAPIDGPTQPPPPLPSTSTAPNGSSSTHHQPSLSGALYPPIRAIYITAPNPFGQLDQFVLDSAERYNLDLYRFGGGMKAALEEYLGSGGGKGVKGVLVGTRRGDPNGDVDELAPTDPSWPSFLRIHPILHWTYSDVWHFLRELEVPYCELYDEGYTSLGSTRNTIPNPLLKQGGGEGYDPAWKLKDESKERAGRLDSSS